MAHWIAEDYGFTGCCCKCSSCGNAIIDLFDNVKFVIKKVGHICPNCGAVMDDEFEYIECKKKEPKPMTVNEYQKECLRTDSECKKWGDSIGGDDKGLLNGLMGLNGEAGECIDILKKYMFQGHALDAEHLAKELGDAAWYIAVSAYHLGYSLETIFKMNVDKLRERYPDGFDAKMSKNRKEGDI